MEGNDYTTKTDGELVEECLKPDGNRRKAFDCLVGRYWARLFTFVDYKVRDYNDAEDLTLTIFLKAYHNIGQISEPERFWQWLKKICYRECINWLHKEKGVYLSLDDAPEEALIGESPLPETEIEVEQSRWKFWLILNEIVPDKQFYPLKCYYSGEFSYEELAYQLRVPVSTLKKWIHRAKEIIKEELPKVHDEEVEEWLRGRKKTTKTHPYAKRGERSDAGKE